MSAGSSDGDATTCRGYAAHAGRVPGYRLAIARDRSTGGRAAPTTGLVSSRRVAPLVAGIACAAALAFAVTYAFESVGRAPAGPGAGAPVIVVAPLADGLRAT